MTWPSLPLRRVANISLGKMIQSAPKDDSDTEAPYLRAAHVQRNGQIIKVDSKTMWFKPDELAHRNLVSGDVVVVEGGAGYGRSAVIREALPGWGFQNSIVRVRPDPKLANGTYLDYSLQSALASGAIEVACFSATIPHFTSDKVAAFRVPVPPVEVQHQIADYLDRETARIDTLIEEQQRLIQMLLERRDSIIDEELTQRGVRSPRDLTGDVRYEVPSGWQVLLLGRVLRQLTNGFVGPTRDILTDEGIRYIQGTHIKSGRIDFARRPFFVSRDWHEQRPRIHLTPGDVLIVQTGDIGRVAVVPPDFGEASCHALQIARVRPELLTGEYLATFLSSRIGYSSLLLRATGALHPHLEAGIRAVPIVVPPLGVQEAIVKQASIQASKVDTLIAETERFIEISRERRAALITAAVTGQIDVREMV